jgi:hypothetical protein
VQAGTLVNRRETIVLYQGDIAIGNGDERRSHSSVARCAILMLPRTDHVGVPHPFPPPRRIRYSNWHAAGPRVGEPPPANGDPVCPERRLMLNGAPAPRRSRNLDREARSWNRRLPRLYPIDEWSRWWGWRASWTRYYVRGRFHRRRTANPWEQTRCGIAQEGRKEHNGAPP